MYVAKKEPKIVRSPKVESFVELCKFADEYGLSVEIDKPFQQFDNLIINVVRKSDKKLIEQEIMTDISNIGTSSAKILKILIKNKK